MSDLEEALRGSGYPIGIGVGGLSAVAIGGGEVAAVLSGVVLVTGAAVAWRRDADE